MSNKIYYLTPGEDKNYFWLDIKGKIKQKNKPYLDYIKEGQITLTISRGKGLGDAMGCTLAITLFSQAFLNVLKENNIDNYTTYKIKTDNSLKSNSGLYYIEINNKLKKYDTHLDIDIKNYIFINHNHIALSRYNYADFSTWDGSDLFTAENTKIIFVTEKLKKSLEDAKLTNLEFTEIKYNKC